MKEGLRDLKFYENNAMDDFANTPISVLRYITELESKLEAKDKECAAKIAAGERLRMEDAMSAINEANGLREKIKEQELIIYGIEEGAEQWKSLCADKDKEIAELKEWNLAAANKLVEVGNACGILSNEIADLKAKLEAAENVQTSNPNKLGYVMSSNLSTDEMNKHWVNLWQQIEIWYGDPKKSETCERLLKRLQSIYSINLNK